jgi:hypothetical protein
MSMSTQILVQITDGRTDLVMDYLSTGHAATSADQNGVPPHSVVRLLRRCDGYQISTRSRRIDPVAG